MKVRLKKVDTYERVIVKALLGSETIELFIDKKFVKKWKFKREKLARSIKIRNINGTNNSSGVVTEVECNMYFMEHVKRIRINICSLGRTKVVLGMLWLAAYNPEID